MPWLPDEVDLPSIYLPCFISIAETIAELVSAPKAVVVSSIEPTKKSKFGDLSINLAQFWKDPAVDRPESESANEGLLKWTKELALKVLSNEHISSCSAYSSFLNFSLHREVITKQLFEKILNVVGRSSKDIGDRKICLWLQDSKDSRHSCTAKFIENVLTPSTYCYYDRLKTQTIFLPEALRLLNAKKDLLESELGNCPTFHNPQGDPSRLLLDIITYMSILDSSPQKINYITAPQEHVYYSILDRVLGIILPDKVPLSSLYVSGVKFNNSSIAEYRQAIRDKSFTILMENDDNEEHESSEISAKLASAAIITTLLSARRSKQLTLSHPQMEEFDSYLRDQPGLYIQYSHARVVSILTHAPPISHSQPSDLPPSSAIPISTFPLIIHLSQYSSILYQTRSTLESALLVGYLFKLSRMVSSLHKAIRVKGREAEVAYWRSLLWECCRVVLRDGLRLLGIEPVDRM